MTTLIAADIFGETPELQSLAIAIGGDVLIAAASDHPSPPCESEAQAYAAFVAAGGVPAYVERLRHRLADPRLAIDRVIGFSAGATALWALLATPTAERLHSATLFYGSRIRDCSELEPRCPVKLIFAERESAFDPAQLVAALKARGLEATIKAGSEHGFMNERSSGFNQTLYHHHLEALRLVTRSTAGFPTTAMNHDDLQLRAYYAARAQEYEAIYAKPERQADLRELESLLPTYFQGRRTLEVACGTGYWSRFIATAASELLALDASVETLEIARAKPWPAGMPRFELGDAYALPAAAGPFDAAFAGFWWSHVPIADRARFLRSLDACLAPGACVVLLDNRFVAGSSTPVAERDAEGNTWQRRRLADGSEHRVLKNFPTEAELRELTHDFGRPLAWIELPYFWVYAFEKRGA